MTIENETIAYPEARKALRELILGLRGPATRGFSLGGEWSDPEYLRGVLEAVLGEADKGFFADAPGAWRCQRLIDEYDAEQPRPRERR